MIDFYLHEYTLSNRQWSYGAPHILRSPVFSQEQKDLAYKMWKTDERKICKHFISEFSKIYTDKEDKILLFAPATRKGKKIFITKVVEAIKKEYQNIIDLTDLFFKKEDVCFGDAKYNDFTIEQLSEFIDVNKETLSLIDLSVSNIFILDDVYATGKSIDLTKYLIEQVLQKDFTINTGVIVKTNGQRITSGFTQAEVYSLR